MVNSQIVFNDNAKNLSEEYVHSVKLAGEVFKLVEEHITPPNPKTYDLWYNYLEGSNKKLTQQVEIITRKGKKLNEEDINLIHQACLDDKDNCSKNAEKTGQELEAACKKLMNLLNSHIEQNDGYADCLVEANKKLNANPTPENLKEVVHTLIVDNRKMAKKSAALNSQLAESTARLNELNQDLAKARANELTDALTLIGNRKCFDQELEKNLELAKKKGHKFSLIIADLDHFKRINDTFGHPVGDAILKLFARLMTKNIKGRDVVARYGGEEFALILPETDVDGSIQLAEQIRQELASQELQVTKDRTPVGKVTASFGVAQFMYGDNAMTILARADRRLYQAKENGRNQVAA